MTQENQSVGVIVGRWQTPELHVGHQALIRYVAQKHSRVMLVVGVSLNQGTLHDPLDFATRLPMLSACIGRYSNSQFIIVPIRDVGDVPLWSQHLDARIGDTYGPHTSVVLYGGRDSFAYQGRYPKLELSREELGAPSDFSASRQREEIAAQGPLNSPEFRAGMIYGAALREAQPLPVMPQLVQIEERLRAYQAPIASPEGYRSDCTCGSAVPVCVDCQAVETQHQNKKEQFLRTAAEDIETLLALLRQTRGGWEKE